MRRETLLAVAMIIVIIIVAVSTCSARQHVEDEEIAEMTASISMCEQHIDSIAVKIPFEDTVAEGDAYEDLRASHEDFESSEDIEVLRMAYKNYMRAYFKVFNESVKLMNSIAVSEYVESLPVHVCETAAGRITK